MKRSITYIFFYLIPIWVKNSLEVAVCLTTPRTNVSSWQVTMPLYNPSEVFVPAKQYGNTIHKKTERNAQCALVYLWSHLQVDCSQSPIFSWDRLDIPRLTVTAILLFKCIERAGVRNYSQSTIQEHRRAYSWWNSTLPETLGSLINYDGDGDGYENVTWKVNPRFFKFCQAYSISFSSLNVGELVWIWILKDCIEVQEKIRMSLSRVSVLHKTWK